MAGTGPLNSGTLLAGRYLIERMLGGGGMGVVYLAQDQRLANRPCAIKEMVDHFIDQQQRLVEIGQITAEEARHHEHKNVIVRSLGARQSGAAGAEMAPIKLRRGDKLLLCSDGLMAHVDDGAIAEIMKRHNDPYETARELIAAANAGGGTDNISVIVVFAS